MQLVKAQLTWKNSVAILDAGARHSHMVRVIHWNALQRVKCTSTEPQHKRIRQCEISENTIDLDYILPEILRRSAKSSKELSGARADSEGEGCCE